MSEDEDHPMPFQIIRGFPCPTTKKFSRKNMEDAMDFVPGDGDLTLASYPKTGTNWLKYITFQIKSKGQFFPEFEDAVFKIVPFIEVTGIALVNAQAKPRFYRYHLAYDVVQKNDKSKCVYIYRNPEDVAVSFYHFTKNMFPEKKYDFNDFFGHFLTGNIGYGNYFQHVLSFYKHRNDENLLLVSYEKLHANRKEGILRIAKFLGEEFYQGLMEDDESLEKVIEHTSFDYMKNNLTLTHPDAKERPSGTEPQKVNFFRKGIVGDGKAVLTENQRELLKEAAEKVLKGTSILEEWYPK